MKNTLKKLNSRISVSIFTATALGFALTTTMAQVASAQTAPQDREVVSLMNYGLPAFEVTTDQQTEITSLRLDSAVLVYPQGGFQPDLIRKLERYFILGEHRLTSLRIDFQAGQCLTMEDSSGFSCVKPLFGNISGLSVRYDGEVMAESPSPLMVGQVEIEVIDGPDLPRRRGLGRTEIHVKMDIYIGKRPLQVRLAKKGLVDREVYLPSKL